MDKAEFIHRLREHLTGQVKNAERVYRNEIESRQPLVDPDYFLKWLESEREQALNTPDLLINNQGRFFSLDDQDANAQIFANLLEFDANVQFDTEKNEFATLDNMNWQEAWELALPYLSNFTDRQNKSWKFRGNILLLIRSIKAAAKARVLTEYVLQVRKPQLDKEKFQQFLAEELKLALYELKGSISRELEEKRILVGEHKFLEYLQKEQLKLLSAPEFKLPVWTIKRLAFTVTESVEHPNPDWNKEWHRVNGNHPLIGQFIARNRVEIRLHKIREILDTKTAKAAKPAKQQSKERPLFTLEEILKDPNRLPALWKRLAELDDPFINSGGRINGSFKSRKHRQVMALANILSHWLKQGYSQFDLYSALCRHIGLRECQRPEKQQTKPGYDIIRINLIADLKQLL